MQPHVRIHTCWGCDPVAFVEMQFPTSGYPKWVLVTLLGSRTLCVNMTMCVFSPFLACHIYIIHWSSIFIDLHKMSIQRVYVNILSTFICSHIDLHRSIRLPSSLWLLWCLLLSIAISVWIFLGHEWFVRSCVALILSYIHVSGKRAYLRYPWLFGRYTKIPCLTQSRSRSRSLGQQQRINFARVLLRPDTQIALIDEGTSACLSALGW